ncbi:hypothetical protein ACIQ6K_39155 [Streptomyces sp. NPDC096354]|uniref:hypothetical protein n=1 Tax=Streptomyces sp. NPDC096354 TaxID=3366088 RepID=UPI00381EB160
MSTSDLPLVQTASCGDGYDCGETGELECGLAPALASLPRSVMSRGILRLPR